MIEGTLFHVYKLSKEYHKVTSEATSEANCLVWKGKKYRFSTDLEAVIEDLLRSGLIERYLNDVPQPIISLFRQ